MKNIINNKTIKVIIDIILVVLTMLMIFSFSASDGVKSEETSKRTARDIITIVYKDKQEAANKFVDNHLMVIRKIAHMIEFALLGFLVLKLLKDLKETFNYKLVLFALGFSYIYAVFDEVHQLAINGRNSSILDTLIDAVGAVIGILINILISRFKINKKVVK